MEPRAYADMCGRINALGIHPLDLNIRQHELHVAVAIV
jgi:hypothetical protein